MPIVAILKNEAVYIKERIEFHRLVVAGRFYLYDNDSTDNVQDIPAPDINNF